MANAPKKPDTGNWDKKTQEQKDRAVLDAIQKDDQNRKSDPKNK